MASDGGKGSSPRPIEDWDRYANNWDAIFKPKKTDPQEELPKEKESD